MDYKKMTARAIVGLMVSDGSITEEIAAKYFPEFAESEDEKIRKGLINGFNFYSDQEYWGTEKFKLKIKDIIAWLEKQGEQKPTKNIVELWKDMRLEVYQQASGNRHEPNYSDDTTKMFSLEDIDEIIEKMSEPKPAENKGMNIVEEDMTPFQKKVFCIIDTAIEEEQGLKQVCDELLRIAHDEIMQKPAWSEEDEHNLNGILDCYKSMDSKWRIWLKSLKDRVQPPSERIGGRMCENEVMDKED